MPEASEVKIITEQLNAHLKDKTLKNIEILSGRYTKKEPENFSKFLADTPIKITEVKCKGKFIYFLTDSPWSIWNTLAMTGGWSKSFNEYSRAEFKLEQESIYFNDTRNFGTLHFHNDEKLLKKKLNSLGPDMLAEDIGIVRFKSLIKKHGKKSLPEFLMNQNIISGVGNYLKAEALYDAKLSPHRRCGNLTSEEIETLYNSIRTIITASYKAGGSTIRNYIDFTGSLGTYSQHFKVYRKDQDPNGNPVITEETLDGRTTHWVPLIQK